MNTKQENKNSAHLGSKRFLEDHVADVNSLPGYEPMKTELDASITKTQGIIRAQEMDKSGDTEVKVDLHDFAISKCMGLSRNMTAFALLGKKDKSLAQAVKLTTAVNRMADTALKEKLEGIVDLAEANKTDPLAVTYGVTGAAIDGARTALSNYLNMMPVPGQNIDEKKRLGRELDAQQRITDGILDEIGVLINMLMETKPEVCNGFFLSREIDDLGTRHMALMLLVKDSVTGTGIKSVRVALLQTAGELTDAGTDLMKSVKRTADKGWLYYKTLPTGTYELTLSMAGYVTQTVTVYVNEGVLTKTEVALVAL